MYKFTVDRWTGASFPEDCTQNGHDRFVDRKRSHPFHEKRRAVFHRKKAIPHTGTAFSHHHRTITHMMYGNPAVMVEDFRPVVLRRHLSMTLPLSFSLRKMYSYVESCKI